MSLAIARIIPFQNQKLPQAALAKLLAFTTVQSEISLFCSFNLLRNQDNVWSVAMIMQCELEWLAFALVISVLGIQATVTNKFIEKNFLEIAQVLIWMSEVGKRLSLKGICPRIGPSGHQTNSKCTDTASSGEFPAAKYQYTIALLPFGVTLVRRILKLRQTT